MSNKKDINSVKKTFERLEALPEELESKVIEIINRKKIVSRLYAEHEFKLAASEIFGSGEPDKIKEVIYNYFVNKYAEIKKRVHDKVMSDKNYLENLLAMLEDPELKDEKNLYTDSFGGFSKEVSDRFGLENELEDYIIHINPDACEMVLRRAKKWIFGSNSHVKSSGYRVISDYISKYDETFEDAERLKLINKNEGMFIKGLKSKNHRVRWICLCALSTCMGYKISIGPESFKPYKEIIKIANKIDDPLSGDAQKVLGLFPKPKSL